MDEATAKKLAADIVNQRYSEHRVAEILLAASRPAPGYIRASEGAARKIASMPMPDHLSETMARELLREAITTASALVREGGAAALIAAKGSNMNKDTTAPKGAPPQSKEPKK